MKKFFIIGMLYTICVSAYATTKCVKAPTSCPSRGHENGSTYWSATCNTGTIKGVAICASTPGEFGDIAERIRFNSDSSKNGYCWCKMTYPFASKWHLYKNSSYTGSWDYCNGHCSIDCSFMVWVVREDGDAWRESLFANPD